MLPSWLCKNALQRLRDFPMQPLNAKAWQQATTPARAFANSISPRLDVHARIFVPRSKLAAQPISGAGSLSRTTDRPDACHTSALPIRTADSLIKSPCSTSSRDCQGHPASQLITCQRPRYAQAWRKLWRAQVMSSATIIAALL